MKEPAGRETDGVRWDEVGAVLQVEARAKGKLPGRQPPDGDKYSAALVAASVSPAKATRHLGIGAVDRLPRDEAARYRAVGVGGRVEAVDWPLSGGQVV